MIKGIIFDLDGTLLNTLDDLTNAVNHTLTTFGYPNKTKLETMMNLGSGSVHLIKHSLPEDVDEDEFKEIHSFYQNYYQLNNNILTKPYDGIIDVLKELKDLNYKLAVVSNKDDHDVKLLINDLFSGLFDVAIGARKNKPVKPDAYLVNLALDELKLTKEEVVYIGDSDVDILTAKNSKLKMITVSWGFRPYDVLINYQAENIINKPSDIISKLIEIKQ